MVRPTLSRAINRPRLTFGIEKGTLVFAFFFLLVIMAALHAKYGFWMSLACGSAVFSLICRISRLYTKRDPHFFSGRFRALFHAASYDPGKFKPFLVEIRK